jgi:Fur family transcriptional regulator, ferric uptake regulator
MDVHAGVSGRMRRGRARYTPQRRELVELLLTAGQPLTVAEIHRRAPHLAQSSVYRNLAVLEQTGVVGRLAGCGDFARFELGEAFTEHHHHLVCSECGAMADVQLPTTVERQLGTELARVARRQDFAIRAHRLDILGLCQSCIRD